jgi:TonB family protein
MSVFASRPLVYSALLHASVVGILALLMVRMQRVPAPVPFIIEWGHAESSPLPPAEGLSSNQSSAPLIKFSPVNVVVPVLEPAAEEEIAEPVRPSRSTVRATTTPSTRPGTARTVTTISAHRRKNPGTATSPRSVPETTVPSATRINMDEVLAPSGTSRTQTPATANPEQDANYWDLFLTKLRDAHQKPAGLEDGLQVRVEFVLRADGTLGDVRVLSSSGDATFDASVVAAFRRVRGLGVPPASKVGMNQITFRTQAD